MSIKWNKILAQEYVKSIGYDFADNNPEKIKAITKITIIKNNYLYYTDLHNLQMLKFPDKFNKSNIHTITNIKTWLKENNKNIELVSEIYTGSKDDYVWKCNICNETFLKSWDGMSDLSVLNSCLYCSNRKVGINNCVATLKPHLIEEWHTTKNGKLTLYDFTCGVDYDAWWICKNNPAHQWRTSIKNRTNNESNCPFCIGSVSSEENNLLTINPSLCEEWDYDKNNKLPIDYTSNSGQYVWWKCKKCDYSWNASIGSRANGNGCPCCAGKIVTLEHCLTSDNPQLAKEWHTIKNGDLTPYDVTPNSGKRIWWKCNVCSHEWEAEISNRNSNKTGCPKCSKSKGEKFIDSILNKYNIPHDSQYTFYNLRGLGGGLLKYDIPVFYDTNKTNLRLLIEYDGEFHYEKQYDNDGFETLQIHDKLKDNYCIKNNIPLLRIPYWEFSNIEQILQKELNIIA